jgi:hypothetical protein
MIYLLYVYNGNAWEDMRPTETTYAPGIPDRRRGGVRMHTLVN